MVESLTKKNSIFVACAIPSASCTTALSCATALLNSYREGFVKNRYMARIFLMPVNILFLLRACVLHEPTVNVGPSYATKNC